MNKTFNFLFYVKKAKTLANGTAPIYLRITIDGRLTEVAVKRYILPEKWNSKGQKVNGTNEEAKSLNAYLKSFEQEVYETQHTLQKNKELITVETLKNKLLGKGEKEKTLVPIFQDHNNKVASLIGKEFASGTLERYKTSLKHTVEFLKWKYNISDFTLSV